MHLKRPLAIAFCLLILLYTLCACTAAQPQVQPEASPSATISAAQAEQLDSIIDAQIQLDLQVHKARRATDTALDALRAQGERLLESATLRLNELQQGADAKTAQALAQSRQALEQAYANFQNTIEALVQTGADAGEDAPLPDFGLHTIAQNGEASALPAQEAEQLAASYRAAVQQYRLWQSCGEKAAQNQAAYDAARGEQAPAASAE